MSTASADGSYRKMEDESDDEEEDEEEREDSLQSEDVHIDEEQVLRELAVLFDAASIEIYGLLRDSYTRFISTEPYQMLLAKKENYIKQWIVKRTASVTSLHASQ